MPTEHVTTGLARDESLLASQQHSLSTADSRTENSALRKHELFRREPLQTLVQLLSNQSEVLRVCNERVGTASGTSQTVPYTAVVSINRHKNQVCNRGSWRFIPIKLSQICSYLNCLDVRLTLTYSLKQAKQVTCRLVHSNTISLSGQSPHIIHSTNLSFIFTC